MFICRVTLGTEQFLLHFVTLGTEQFLLHFINIKIAHFMPRPQTNLAAVISQALGAINPYEVTVDFYTTR